QRIAISPASVTVLGLSDQGAALLRLNDTGHLPKFYEPKEEKEAKTEPEGTTEKKDEPEKEERKMPEANIVHDLNPVSRVTVGALGEPGHREFYLQGRQGTTLVSLLAEKTQMTSLGQG